MNEDFSNHNIILPHNHGDISNVLKFLPDESDCSKAASVFSILADGSRLRIFWLLCHSKECVQNIAAAVNMSAPAVSHHLRVLRDAGLIQSQRVGKEAHYTIAETDEAKVMHETIDRVFKMACPNK